MYYPSTFITPSPLFTDMAETGTNTSTQAVAISTTEDKSKPPPSPEAHQPAANPEPATMTDKEAAAAESSGLSAKTLAGLLTILSFILSLPILASVIWLLYMRDYDCENLLRLPRLQTGIGIALIILFMISTATLFLRSRFPMPGFLLVMVPLLVMLVVGLALVGAYDMESRSIPASPGWFRLKVNDNNNWNNIKLCVYDTGECDDLFSRSITVKSYDLTTSKLSPIESGCCKPPPACDMEFVNATFWKRRDGAQNETGPNSADCDIWQNDRTKLCYSCQTCKEGFVKTLTSKWWKLGLFLVLMALLLIVCHLLLFVATMWERLAQ